ncbi:replication initiation protein (plasmid) [Ralstonia solanacearum]|uniref:replication initiation protein n=1 Tax=Ralstonia pseudosolanacearum TaxID=1310165 RepID=UPI000DAED695|nr:replication initiation protein [Ralstonia pseudosolanacearum]MCK4140021.1 RepB family plasmid replication initiator protein [Ralstonia pseudosolanacearum]NKG08120.1 replication initiation protein [Ralstonia solanacearum]QWF62956.1 replication initiation protein [Ralstonia solanacearum]RAA06394.1 replication initiation protein [Ralstonia pseudosolanacearum]
MPNTASIPTQSELKKHVATVHVSGELSLLERKIVNVLLLNAYDDLLTRKTHRIPVGILSTMLGFDSKNTDALKKALIKVMSTPVSFDLLHDGGDSEWNASPLIGYAGIRSGVCSYEYSDWLAKKLANPEIYTLININVQKQFSGGYSLALYENCLRFKRTGSTGWISVETWRRLLGAEASTYDEFKHFNGEVIKKSVKEINTVSNILVAPEYKREGRRVTQIRFLVEENPQKSMLDAGDNEQAKIRNSETFRRLTALGIGDRLAISWIQQEPERAEQTAAYVEEKTRRKQIKGSTGGYARAIFENGGNLTIQADKEKLPPRHESTGLPKVDAQAEARTKAVSSAIKALGIQQKRELANAYLAQGGKGNSYSPETVTFSNVLERTAYTAWLRSTIAEILASNQAI